ncbi:hypothetical protein KKF05_05370 [Patescibacteria group bacterium]|nr:hypothetical protein [Patescibacteria group bacterium]MBU1029574.1 hypothetical protein [Patescibacteria group bacterium]MBU1916428.1 hypothetical protein [Patescibacteria group bacterium]
MSSRTKKVIVGVVLLILLLLLWWLFGRRPESAPVNSINDSTKQPTPIGALNATNQLRPPVFEVTEPAQPAPIPDKPDIRSSLRSLAAAFAERYGSYSNQGNYENLEELQALMTDSLAKETADFIVRSRAADSATAVYVGLTTRSISTTIQGLNEDAGRATVVVNAQREEITTLGNRVFYQELELAFIRIGEIWRVDSAIWAGEGG